MAPEVYQGQSHTKSCDLFSLGVLMNEMYEMYPLPTTWFSGIASRPSFKNLNIHPAVKQLIVDLVSLDPSKRPAIEAVAKCPPIWREIQYLESVPPELMSVCRLVDSGEGDSAETGIGDSGIGGSGKIPYSLASTSVEQNNGNSPKDSTQSIRSEISMRSTAEPPFIPDAESKPADGSATAETGAGVVANSDDVCSLGIDDSF